MYGGEGEEEEKTKSQQGHAVQFFDVFSLKLLARKGFSLVGSATEGFLSLHNYTYDTTSSLEPGIKPYGDGESNRKSVSTRKRR
jgi:hypothetical protein